MHLQRTNQELFFKTFLSAADIVSLLPEQMPNRHEIAESMPNGLKVLAYYNGNIQSVHPKISYATEGFYRKKVSLILVHFLRAAYYKPLKSSITSAKAISDMRTFPY